MGIVKMPVTGPITSQVFPLATMYDLTESEPVDWKLCIALESQSPISLQAVTDGYLYTLPGNEILPSDFKTIGMDNYIPPQIIRLYLVPDPTVNLNLSASLKAANLGESIYWFLFDNVDASSVYQTIVDSLKKRGIFNMEGTLDVTEENFLTGHGGIYVKAGDRLGTPSTKNASKAGHVRLEFGVHSINGYVDPVTFFSAVATSLDAENSGGPDDLTAVVGSLWPILATNDDITTLTLEASKKLYPNAVLQEAYNRLAIAYKSPDWRQITNEQKILYLQRLYNGAKGAVPGFVFNKEEMVNLCQLEAVVEFFNYWKDPGSNPQCPEIQDFTLLNQVDFGSYDDFLLVIVDPFNHALLGVPELPKPDYFCDPHVPQEQPCDTPQNTPPNLSPFSPDKYEGVLFFLYKGQVQSWYRNTTYTSHLWEDSEGRSL